MNSDEQLRYYENKLAFEIDSWDLKSALKSGENVVIIDARSPEAYQKEHIPGAINIPHREMNQETTASIDKTVLIVTSGQLHYKQLKMLHNSDKSAQEIRNKHGTKQYY